MKLKRNKLNEILTYITFGLILFLPRTVNIFKYIFVGISGLICLFYVIIKIKEIKIRKNIMIWFILSLIINMIWILIGAINDNNIIGLKDEFRINIIWASIYFIFIIYISNEKKCNLIVKTLIVVNFLISIYTILIYIDSKFMIGLNFLYRLDSQARIGFHDGYVQITSHNLGTLLFTTPFLIGIFMNSKKKIITGINIMVSILAILVSGRRALLLAIVVSVILTVILNLIEVGNDKLKVKKYFKFIVFGLMIALSTIIVLQSYEVIDLSVIKERLIESLTGGNNNIRIYQAKELFEGFKEVPILGSGFGIGVDSIIRSPEKPWVYEVMYMSKLYNMGIVGFLLYFFTLFFNIVIALKVILKYKEKAYIMKGLMIGYISFLIMCFTNPYLGSFDFSWVLFIIPMYYNFYSIYMEGENG